MIEVNTEAIHVSFLVITKFVVPSNLNFYYINYELLRSVISGTSIIITLCGYRLKSQGWKVLSIEIQIWNHCLEVWKCLRVISGIDLHKFVRINSFISI